MLHIILGILKFTGIVLAVILLLAAAIVFSLLFIPVRYRCAARKVPEHTEAELKFSWFLRFITFYLRYDLKEKKPVWILRICGVTPENLLKAVKKLLNIPQSWKKKVKRKSNKNIGDKKRKNNKNKKRNAPEVNYPEKIDSEMIDHSKNKDEENKQEVKDQIQKDQIQNDQIQNNPAEDNHASNDANNNENNKDQKENEEPANSLKQKITDYIRKILDIIYQIPVKIQNIKNSIRNKKESVQNNVQNKVQGISDKIQCYLGLIEEYEVRLLFGEIFPDVFCLLRHYSPGKLNGYIHFGVGDPALTGELTGLIYVLLPSDAACFQVMPEFTEKIFETELDMKGKIRACHAVWLVWKLYRNKKLMRLIKEMRSSRRSR